MDKFIRQFTGKKIDYYKQNSKYFLRNNSLIGVVSNIKKKAETIGLFLGEKNNEFKPSLALLEILSKFSSQKAILHKRAELKFLYGKDVFGDGVISCDADSGLVLVQNQDDENLGYGKIVGKKKDKMNVFIKNILDRGDFLRRER